MNYLASERPNIASSAKGLAHCVSSPSKGCQFQLKRLGRYLVIRPRAVLDFRWQAAQHRPRIFTDADWAGCKATRK